MIKKCLYFSLLLFVNACASIETVNIDTGKNSLWFFNQSYLRGFDLKTREDFRVSASMDTLHYLKALGANAIYQTAPQEIIFDGKCPKNIQGASCLYRGSLTKGVYQFISEGELSAYFHESHQVFYLKNYSALNNYITFATLKDNKLDSPYPIIRSHWAYQNIVYTDQTHFVIDDEQDSGVVYLYDINTHTSKRLNIPFCHSQLWIAKENRLLCSDEQFRFFSTPINGSKKIKYLNLRGSDVGVLDYNALKNEMLISRMVFSTSHGLETPSLWIYNFDKNQLTFLKYSF